MAKVMVSIPDDLLARVDAEAVRLGSSRSAVLRGFADDALRDRAAVRAKRRRALLTDLSDLSGRFGGDVAEQVKRSRPN
jgi:metal-responsive CopG/Arc/MetJ family transcriptional regulator